MDKDFIPYEQALELKELGFDESCLCSWMGNNYLVMYQKRHKEDDTYLPAPLYQQAFRWFREEYGYIGGIRKLRGTNNILGDFYKDEQNHFMLFGETYEDCELKALKHLIDIAKQK